MPNPSSTPVRNRRQVRTKPAKLRAPDHSHPQFIKLEVIGTFSSELATPTVMISTQTHSYIFNCAEGTQRLFQNRFRVPRSSDIFLTRLNWDVSGGLPGYLLTASELENARTQIHGPKNLTHFLATFRNYLFRTSMDLTMNEIGETPAPYIDQQAIITPILLSLSSNSSAIPNGSSKFSFANAISYHTSPLEGTDQEILDHKKDIVHEMFKKGVINEDMDDDEWIAQFDEERKRRSLLINQHLPPTSPTDITMAYLVKNKDTRGKFDLEKARALKIPAGRLYSRLANGETIEMPYLNEAGETVMRTVTPKDVLGNPTPGKSILILDIPRIPYVKKVLENERLNSESVKNADVAVHMLSNDVVNDAEYIEWMRSFKSSTKHLVLAPKLTPDNLGIPDSFLLDLDRNALDDTIFPLPYHAGRLEFTPNSYSKKFTPAPALPSPYTYDNFITDVRVGSEVNFLKGIVYNARPNGDGIVESKHFLGQGDQNRLGLDSIIMGTKKLISDIGDTRESNRYPGGDVELITLGTGSAIPTTTRNVSCTVVRIPGVGSIILDCGEGTLASLKRHFSPSQYSDFFRHLRTIYVSHLHADHHLGLIGVIKQYTTSQRSLPSDQQQPIFVIGPWRLFNSLYEYNQVEDIGLDDYVIPFFSHNLIPRMLVPAHSEQQSLDLGLYQGFLTTMNLRSVETCFVPHCAHAFGIAITHKSGWKIVYSGDCRPSADLVEIGRDATVCIHEATFGESQPQDALNKMHCTTGEAIMIGKRMGAQHMLLTHFSQKWSRTPEFVLEWENHKEETEKYGNVGIAFDHMAVRIRDMWKLPLMFPAFEALYQDQKEKKKLAKRKNALSETQTTEMTAEIDEPAEKKRRLNDDTEEEMMLHVGH